MSFTESKMNRLKALLLANGDLYRVEDIIELVQSGHMQSFVGENGSWVVTRIYEYPRKKALDIVVALGDLDDLHNLQRSVEDFAREHGCAMMMASAARAGWEHEMTPGWKKTAYWFIKEL